MPDKEELYATLDRVIEAAPLGGWDQGSWVRLPDPWDEWCGTTGCFAGHYLISQGFTELKIDHRRPSAEGVMFPHGVVIGMINPETGEVIDTDEIPDLARRGLRLDLRRANLLFCANNSLEDLKEMVDEICGEAE